MLGRRHSSLGVLALGGEESRHRGATSKLKEPTSENVCTSGPGSLARGYIPTCFPNQIMYLAASHQMQKGRVIALCKCESQICYVSVGG